MKTIKTSIESLLPLIEESFHNNQEISFIVKGTSMSPTLIDNETVVSLQQFHGTLQKYHIYLYKVQDKILLHRYIQTKHNAHQFRGDNCVQFEYVPIQSIIGEVTLVDQQPFTVSWNKVLFLKRKQLKQFIKKLIRG